MQPGIEKRQSQVDLELAKLDTTITHLKESFINLHDKLDKVLKTPDEKASPEEKASMENLVNLASILRSFNRRLSEITIDDILERLEL